jgi:ubiquitin C-terminal hydrolase
VLDGDNRYACDGCRQRCRASRSTRFEVAPNSLVLCLKRFGTGRFGKINKVRLRYHHYYILLISKRDQMHWLLLMLAGAVPQALRHGTLWQD